MREDAPAWTKFAKGPTRLKIITHLNCVAFVCTGLPGQVIRLNRRQSSCASRGNQLPPCLNGLGGHHHANLLRFSESECPLLAQSRHALLHCTSQLL